MEKSSVSMKLLIDTQAKKVLFAEAGKDSVDVLFLILSLPVATVIKLLRKRGMMGSISNLYKSVENLNESYIKRNQSKATLLEPVAQVSGSSVPLLLFNEDPNVSISSHTLRRQGSDEGGFVKGMVTYMVMDDLEVKPMSTISSITLLNKFNVKDVTKLEERVVDLGGAEAVNLLKASFQSDKVLTDVFLKGN